MGTLEKYQNQQYPDLLTAIELLKPITWFPPLWAFICGAISTGLVSINTLWIMFFGLLLAGPIVCGMSQAVNDWCDRHVDAINEPGRPIPSGRMPEKWGLAIAIILTLLGLLVGWTFGIWGFLPTVLAVFCAWIYSIEPFRLKRSGVWGPFLVGICYEGLPWFTGAAILSSGLPSIDTITLALLFALGAFGIMTLNDFKALEGDRKTGINSLPVKIGAKAAAKTACVAMIVPQIIVISLFFLAHNPIYATLLLTSLFLQLLAMKRLLKNPERYAPWYNATGVSLYVAGMLVCAIALGSGVSLL